MRVFVCIGVAFTALFTASRRPALACNLCGPPSVTLTEQISQSDVAVLGQFVEATQPDGKKVGRTVYRVTHVLRASRGGIKKGTRVVLTRYRNRQSGDLSLLLGTQSKDVEWSSPLALTEASFDYIVQSPAPEVALQQRLVYFLDFLEHSDELISNDAYAEFANAPYKDIAAIRDKLSAKTVRKWALSKETSPTRLGLYGLLLGLCGNKDDAESMKATIGANTEGIRLGIDGFIAGYLILAGTQGLEFIDESKLKDKRVAFSEAFAAMRALEFVWAYDEGTFKKDRLKASMRLLLDRPELADMVIRDLARWKDWEVQDRLMFLYGAEAYDIPAIKRSIVRYMLVCAQNSSKKHHSKDEPSEQVKLPKHIQTAKKHLATLRKKDPKFVANTERFFFLK